ncbi:MAG: hypothetical protein WAM70_21045 [Pyrinomonadaceae bacterium]
MNRNSTEPEFDTDTFSREVTEVTRLFREKTREHSALLKEAEKAGWEASAVERAQAILKEIEELQPRFQRLNKFADDYLAAQGITLSEKSMYQMDEVARYWREDLHSEAVPITGYIEDSLADGLEALIGRLPKAWWKEQLRLREAQGSAHLRESLELYGGVSGIVPSVSLHRYALALILARESLDKRDDYDIYAGSLLVPSVGALCRVLPSLNEVRGGLEKLDELYRAPSEELDSRLYELCVAGRAASLGRSVEFLAAGSDATPDLRLHDLPYPAVVECKRQSRLSDYERQEFETIQSVFRQFTSGGQRRSLIGTFSIVAQQSIQAIGADTLVESSLKCTAGLNPYGSIKEPWGTVTFTPLDVMIDLQQPTRLYSPAFLKQVFKWDFETTEFDGICAVVANNRILIADRAVFPFGIKWRCEADDAVKRKARSLAGLLAQAVRQIPVGETGFMYLAYEESHRAAIADSRTQRLFDQTAKWEIRKRAINPELIIVNRLYPGALDEGRPNLIESAVPIGFSKDNTWAGVMPFSVFVESRDRSEHVDGPEGVLSDQD